MTESHSHANQPDNSRLPAQERAEKSILRRTAIDDTPVPDIPAAVHDVLAARGQPLPPPPPAAPPPPTGHEFGHVRVHGGALGKIQPKLTTDRPGDAYEQEADRVAEQVMRLADPAGPAPAGVGAPAPHTPLPSLARKEKLQRQPLDEGEEEEEEDEEEDEVLAEAPAEEEEDPLQRKALGGQLPDVTPEIEAGVRSSAGEGRPLPEATRAFFEPRFGRDLGAVRVHTGLESESLNSGLHSYAFTHRNHIWLGAGQQPAPTRLLAHELAHVMQQVDPPVVQRSPLPGPVTHRPPGEVLQRFAPYWEPAHMNGTRTHNEVLPAISTQASIFVEAPVPNANKLGADFDKRGIADMYDASTTVGVYFEGDQQPARLRSARGLLRNGQRFAHRTEAAPQPGRRGTVTDVDRAPTNITVGDLKPSHGTIEALEGEAQVRHYLEGFRLANREVNELAANNKTSPADQTWTLISTEIYSQAQLEAIIPPQYRYPASAQTPRQLVLKQNGRVRRPVLRATGRLILNPDPNNAGIMNYIWLPDADPTVALPDRLRALDEEMQRLIIVPVRRAPGRGSIRENFDLGEWRRNRQRIKREYRRLAGTAAGRTGEDAALVLEAHEAGRSATRLPMQALPAQTVQAGQAVHRLRFWTSIPAGVIGTFRRIFGRTFIKVYDGYVRMRTRFSNWLRGRRFGGGGGGLVGAVFKVAFSVLKMAGVFLLNRTASLLQESLLEGITRKLISLIPEENIAELQGRLQQVQEMRDQLTGGAIRTADALVESVFPGYQEKLDRIQQVVEILNKVRRVVTTLTDLVRWGARAIACLAPPALGCLWGLLMSVIEELAAVVIQSCWFQAKIAPHVARLGFLNEWSRELAQGIINGIRALLPEPLHDVFADVEAVPPSANQIECDDTEGPGRAITDDQQAVLDLQERIGEERFTAFLDLVRANGTPEGVPLNRARAEAIGQFIEQNGITAEQLRAIARNRGGAPVDLQRFLDSLKRATERSPVEPVRPRPEEVPVEAPEYKTVVVGTRDGGEGGGPEPEEGAEEEGGSEGGEPEPAESPQAGGTRADVREARARPSSTGNTNRVTGWSIVTVAVRGRLAEGQVIRIDRRMSTTQGGRRLVRYLRDLEMRVTEVAPSETNPRQQEAFLEVTRDQGFRISAGEQYFYLEGDELIHRF